MIEIQEGYWYEKYQIARNGFYFQFGLLVEDKWIVLEIQTGLQARKEEIKEVQQELIDTMMKKLDSEVI